jgi:hypothetical protein
MLDLRDEPLLARLVVHCMRISGCDVRVLRNINMRSLLDHLKRLARVSGAPGYKEASTE